MRALIQRMGVMGVLVATSFTLLGAETAWAASSCAGNGAQGPASLHNSWIMTGWEKRVGDPPFDFRTKLGRFYDWSRGEVLLYDDLSPGRAVARSAAAYSAIWTPIIRSNREMRHAVLNGPDVVLGTDLATSTLEFAARLEAGNGAVSGIRDRSTLVWRCSDDGWKIVREHNSSHPVDRSEIDRLVRR